LRWRRGETPLNGVIDSRVDTIMPAPMPSAHTPSHHQCHQPT